MNKCVCGKEYKGNYGSCYKCSLVNMNKCPACNKNMKQKNRTTCYKCFMDRYDKCKCGLFKQKKYECCFKCKNNILSTNSKKLEDGSSDFDICE